MGFVDVSKHKSKFLKMIIHISWWILIMTASAFAVWADLLIREARWTIWPGVLVVVGGLFVAFGSLGFSLVRAHTQDGNRIWLTALWMLMPTVPALVVALRSGLTDPQVFVRVSLIYSATGIGVGMSRLSSAESKASEVNKPYQIARYVGQVLVMYWLALAMLIYVSAPRLHVVFE
jgi:hypothetical protein